MDFGDFNFFSKCENSANLSTQKKSIYIGYDPEKKKEKKI